MKELQLNFEGIMDSTGYLFSLTKCLAAVLKNSRYKDYAEDIVATSGFAFRMWAAKDLCPSAMSIWEFQKQKEWVENGGLTCDYVERMWGEDQLEEARRREAVQKIKESIDDGVAAVVWDLGDCEWGIIKGYDDDTQTFAILRIDSKEAELSYDKLGKMEIPILSALMITGKTDKAPEQILRDTKALAAAHLRGEEWCDNAKGLAAYDTIISFVNDNISGEIPWELEYYLGTYAALKWYAWKFFIKYDEQKCAEIYERVYQAWQTAFDTNRREDICVEEKKERIIELLRTAKEAEEEFISSKSSFS